MAETMPMADYLREIVGPALAKKEAEFLADASARLEGAAQVTALFGYKTILPVMVCKVTA